MRLCTYIRVCVPKKQRDVVDLTEGVVAPFR